MLYSGSNSSQGSGMERYNYRYNSSAGATVGTSSMISQQATKSVANAYVKVMNEVCSTVRETFLDEGVEISILDELRRLWEYKLHQSKVGVYLVRSWETTIRLS